MLYRSPASLSHKINKAISTLSLHFSICGPFTGDDSNPSVKEKLLLINGLSVVLLLVLSGYRFLFGMLGKEVLHDLLQIQNQYKE